MKVRAPFVGVVSPYSGWVHLFALAGSKYLKQIGGIVGPEYVELREVEPEKTRIEELEAWITRSVLRGQ